MWGERVNKPPPGVPVNFWSPTLNNVSWSKDNIIAIGGCEHVAILTPKFRSPKDDADAWARLEIRINIFSEEEVPLMLPLSWRSMSVGEEQSELFCNALAWSPPGLGKYRRCVLAILTANHVLAIWECTGKPDAPADWKRVCIVNHALQEYAAAHDTDGPDQERAEKRKIRQRIRSFAWSQAPPSATAAGFGGASAPLSQPYLAVSNDMGEVFVLKIKSPYDLLSMENTKWSISVIHNFTSKPNPTKHSSLLSCMPITFERRKTFVDQLAWSPWTKDATGTLSSVLAMTFQSSLHCRLIRAGVTADDTILELGPVIPRIIDDSKTSPAGQIKWMPKLSADGEMYLLYPCRGTLNCIAFNVRKATGVRVTNQPLETTWDEISGITFTKDHRDLPVVQIAYSINSSNAAVLGWTLPLTSNEKTVPPAWQQALQHAEALYSEENELDGHVMTRTYGIDASPLGDLFAVNSSNHPTDGVEYIIASDQLSTLSVVSAREAGEHEILPAAGGPSLPSEISTEAALFSLQRFVERVPETELVENIFQFSLLQTLDLGHAPSSQHNQMPITEDTPVRSIMRQVRENILFNKDSVAYRTAQLARFARREIPKNMPPNPTVVRRIATEVVRMPHFISEASDLSQTITHIHCLIIAKLDLNEGRTEEADGLSDQDVEICGICSNSIAFESLRWARCPNGHQFTRCALSFLAIQTPGTAKFCGICNTQYLNEYLIPELQPCSSNPEVGAADLAPEKDGDQWGMAKQGGVTKEPLISLSRILFSAIDRCVCCGGKFVG